MPPAFLFPISKTILSCVQSVPMKRPKLTAMMEHIMAREQTEKRERTHLCVGRYFRRIQFMITKKTVSFACYMQIQFYLPKGSCGMLAEKSDTPFDRYVIVWVCAHVG